MSETPTPPACPGCGQSDRITALDPASALTKLAVAAHGALAGWFCDRCCAVLSALPAVSAGPLATDRRVTVVNHEPDAKRKKGAKVNE